MESGVYFGWAGLSSSKATGQQLDGSESNYKLMAKDVYDNMTSALSGSSNNSADDQGKRKATQDKGAVYPMVMSIGWNPYYKNTVRSVEVHIMEDFALDFYDTHMNLIILGFIRPELDYVSVESLINDIKTDIDVAGRSLARPAYVRFAEDPYLLEFSGRSEVAS